MKNVKMAFKITIFYDKKILLILAILKLMQLYNRIVLGVFQGLYFENNQKKNNLMCVLSKSFQVDMSL